MKSITCNVQQNVQEAEFAGRRTENLDGLPELAPVPTSIKEQMPVLASMLQDLAANIGREQVAPTVKAAIDLRRAYDRDDYAAVKAVYDRKNGWVTCAEGGHQVGVPARYIRAFWARHRAAR